jgi:F0F1-type ATP synthase assembly protein I
MIKIFESDEEQTKPASNDAAAFSLNMAPDDGPQPSATVTEGPVAEEISPVEPSPIEPESPAPASPWEKIGEEPANIAQEIFEEPELPVETAPDARPVDTEASASPPEPVVFEDEKPSEPEIFDKLPYQPQTTDETVRTSGLAWNAGIIFFGSVVFMMFLGWGADLLLGSSPWGLVGGIIFGSIIGFIQFVRISSRIFRK